MVQPTQTRPSGKHVTYIITNEKVQIKTMDFWEWGKRVTMLQNCLFLLCFVWIYCLSFDFFDLHLY